MSGVGSPITGPDGVEYPSHAALARAFGVTKSAVIGAKKHGRLIRLGKGKEAGSPIEFDGVGYPSQAALARAVGVSEATVSGAKQQGRVDQLGRGKEAGTPIEWNGVQYPSVEALARAAGVSASTVFIARKKGRLATLGKGSAFGRALAAVSPKRFVPVKSGPQEWPSQRACAAALGVSYKTVWSALERGTLDKLVARRLGGVA